MPQFQVNVTTAGTPVPLTAVPTYYQWATFVACKTIAGPTTSPNTGKVKLGFSPTTGNQPIEIAVGGTFGPIYVGAAQQFNFAQIYVDAVTNGDGVAVFYI